MTYCFHKTHPGTPLQQRKVKQVIEEWEKQYTNIHFDHVDQDATIRISFDSSSGSWTLTGCDIMKSTPSGQTMNLSTISNTTEDAREMDKWNIVHQLHCCLGLEKEYGPQKGGHPGVCIGLDPRFIAIGYSLDRVTD